jgi:hypothetical protein
MTVSNLPHQRIDFPIKTERGTVPKNAATQIHVIIIELTS